MGVGGGRPFPLVRRSRLRCCPRETPEMLDAKSDLKLECGETGVVWCTFLLENFTPTGDDVVTGRPIIGRHYPSLPQYKYWGTCHRAPPPRGFNQSFNSIMMLMTSHDVYEASWLWIVRTIVVKLAWYICKSFTRPVSVLDSVDICTVAQVRLWYCYDWNFCAEYFRHIKLLR